MSKPSRQGPQTNEKPNQSRMSIKKNIIQRSTLWGRTLFCIYFLIVQSLRNFKYEPQFNSKQDTQ
jgi:preprotein translocase subunit SecG